MITKKTPKNKMFKLIHIYTPLSKLIKLIYIYIHTYAYINISYHNICGHICTLLFQMNYERKIV
jgi:hypothetical protein